MGDGFVGAPLGHFKKRSVRMRLLSLRVAVFVLCGLMFGPACGLSAGEDAVEDAITVEVTGTLRTGLMAIGGETTGTVIVANGVSWELDLRALPEVKAKIAEYDGKKVVVSGTFEQRRGVERRKRDIVTVTTLRLAQNEASDK
jgi:hypothetical protein